MKKILTDKTIALTLASFLLSCTSSVLADDQVPCTGQVTVTIVQEEDGGRTLTPLQTSKLPDDRTCLLAHYSEISFSATEVESHDAGKQVNAIGICQDGVLQATATINPDYTYSYMGQTSLTCDRDDTENGSRHDPGCWPQLENCYYSGTQVSDLKFMLTF